MVCHVVLRRTHDWDTVRPDSLDAPFLTRAATVWSRCFRLGYGACRARIKAVTLDNLRVIPARITEAWEPADVDRAGIGDGDALVLCDDDDLFHPQLVEHLEGVRSDGSWDRPVLWPDGKHGYHRSRDPLAQERALGGMFVLPRVLERPLVKPYRGPYCAIPGRLLHRMPEILDICWTHSGIVDYFRDGEPPVAQVSTPMSLIVKHPCSKAVLRHAASGEMTESEVAEVLRLLLEQYVHNPTELQPAFRWAADYVERVTGIFRDALG